MYLPLPSDSGSLDGHIQPWYPTGSAVDEGSDVWLAAMGLLPSTTSWSAETWIVSVVESIRDEHPGDAMFGFAESLTFLHVLDVAVRDEPQHQSMNTHRGIGP